MTLPAMFASRSNGRTKYEAASKMGMLYQVTEDIAGLRIAIVNVYFVGVPGSTDWVLIDAGLGGSASRIRRAAEERFGPAAKPKAILLTHGHFDHVGALRTLAAEWDVPVYAHPMELPYLTGKSSYPPPDPLVGGGIMPLMSIFFPRSPIDLADRVRPLPKDGSVPGLPGWRWFHTPGHTPGHVSFFRETDRALIAGDALITVKQESMSAVLEQRPELHGPPMYFTPDWNSSRKSVEHLASMHPKVIATGHGLPLRGDEMQHDLQRLAANFAELAVPRSGRYVREPATANLHGTVHLPRSPWQPWVGLLLFGTVIALGFKLGRRCCSSDDPNA